MKDYTSDVPVFSESISIVEETDLVNDENNNAAAIQLLQNSLFLRKLIEALTQQVASNAKTAKDYTDANYQQSTGYTDQKIADLINGAPSTLDTLGEIAKAMADNEDVVKALEEAIGKKANQKEMESLLEQKLDKTGDSGNTTANYTSDDTQTPSGWKNFALFTGLEKVKEFFTKVSTMGSNLRWMYKMLGTTDISKLGDGTVTGAIDSLNSNLIPRISFTIDANSSVTLQFVSHYAAIISCGYSNSNGYMMLACVGYGTDAIRNHAAELLKGTGFSYTILDLGSSIAGIRITHNGEASDGVNYARCSVLMLYGNIPSIE